MFARTSLVAALAFAGAKLALAQDDVSSSQFWHERYHGLLSMAAYNSDPTTACAQTFDQAALEQSFPDSTAAPWTYVQGFGPTVSGGEGFVAVIPEMDKVVMVFKGLFGWESTFNQSTVDVGELFYLGDNCLNCTAHAAATQAYIEAKEITNDWELVKYYVNTTGAQWSITGHGFGGMVAQVASLDLGWRGLAHWTHNHGAARVFNPAAATLLNSLYGGEAGQRVVANDDPVPTYIPESEDYTFALQGFHILGNGTSNATYGYDFTVCNDPSDAACHGNAEGRIEDHLSYYTPIGMCGKPYYGTNDTVADAYLSTASSAFYATATSTFVAPTTEVAPTTTSEVSSTASASASGSATEAAAADNAAASGQTTTNAANDTNGASVLGVAGSLVAVVAGAVALLA
ncbi:hypothetical protein DMC30DRAFT_444650 [Rhodotorula diobovata]|uniref:Fungal lipase-type domain-containing protein n=1 Tax=Rhodotorula diobovata TaxID=5288 RepID=A0A5C5G2H7_9BASI|nr:hypothetical protein DMC30DRAFT_444650 [Rhodotorula diobovata]